MMTQWMQELPWNLIVQAARPLSLDINFVAAIVMQETTGVSWKTKYEPNFRHLLTPGKFAVSRGISEETETINQKTSWGLMQIMGAVAREVGFRTDLPELGKPAIGLKWGCMKLRAVTDRYGKGGLQDVAAAWNAGSIVKDASGALVNQRYVVSVMRYYNDLVR